MRNGGPAEGEVWARRRSALERMVSVVMLTRAGEVPRAYAIDTRAVVSRAMQKFRENNVEAAVDLMDDVLREAPQQSPYLWQRGIALYYLDQFGPASAQFRADVKVNPSDAEEAVWACISESARGHGDIDASRKGFIKLQGRDGRQVMGSVLPLFRSGDEEAKKALIHLSEKPAASAQDASDAFYSSLYLGLYYESLGDIDRSRRWIETAHETPYGRKAKSDFMTAVAEVHLARRGWLPARQGAQLNGSMTSDKSGAPAPS